ncbi:MAG: carbohydrate kinase family protein [Candidatus Lokiarchaeota archaeon]|nr:carbohydrate kinase family protein [Candidatus Lokiarchaeota archaeon]
MYEPQNNFDCTLKSLETIKKKLKQLETAILKKNCFLGFDGYVDSLYSVVQNRKNADEWTRMSTLKDFGELLIDVSGSSANVERVLKKRIFGGFAPNTCRAMNALGTKVYLLAALGYPKLNELYISLGNVESFPIANPGQTLGLEFDDGKVMITDFEPILNITWKTLIDIIQPDNLVQLINNSDILGFGHWALVPNLNDIWKHFLNDLFPSISNLKNKLFFVDIADIRKRSANDIKELIKILQKINDYIPVLLSANDQEALYLSRILPNVRNLKSTQSLGFIESGKKINREINLSYLVIHSPHFATISTEVDHYWITEGFTSKPKFTVGAGDHFHSGTVLGISCGLAPPEAILMGNALTAIFVRTGNSPNFYQLSQFIDRYMEYITNDNPNFP